MTTYYVRKTGSDAAAGTSAGAAWLTIGKALGAAGIASGDTVYIGAGTYRETVTVGFTPSAATYVKGDVDGVNTGDAGEVIWTAYTTNDKTAPGGIPLTIGAKPYLNISRITFVGGTGGGGEKIITGTAGSHDTTIDRCTFLHTNGSASGTPSAIGFVATVDAALNLTVTNCTFLAARCVYGAVYVSAPSSASADYNLNVVINNCLFLLTAGGAMMLQPSGANTFKPGGFSFYNNTVFVGGNAIWANGALCSATYPINAYDNVIMSGGVCFQASSTGQIIEDYNWATPAGSAVRANTSTGTNTKAASSSAANPYAPLFEIGQSVAVGRRLRPFMAPMAGSPMLGLGGQAGGPAGDFAGVTRPAGGAVVVNAAGYLERGNSFGKETGTVRTGSNAISITGPGSQDFDLAVDASSTTVTAYVRWDATYAGTKPSMSVLNGTEAGVADATATATGSSGAWEQLSLNFTPTASGIVTIRFVSSDTNGGGKMFVDDFAVA